MHTEKTGYITEDIFLYKTLYLTELELQKINISLEEIAKKFNVDFVVLLMNGKVNFVHFTNEDNLNLIEKENTLNSAVDPGDLGIGVYAIPDFGHDFHEVGFDNVLTFLENYEDQKIGKVSGSFNGEYGLSIYGFQHKGYLLLKNGSFESIMIDVLNVEDLMLGKY